MRNSRSERQNAMGLRLCFDGRFGTGRLQACESLAPDTNLQIRSGQSVSAPPGSSKVNFFCYSQGIIDLYAKIFDRAFNLGMAQQDLHGPQVSGTTVNEGRLGSPERVRAEEVGVQSDAGNPVGDKPTVLPCCEAATRTMSAREQEFAWFLVSGPYVFFDCLTGLLR